MQSEERCSILKNVSSVIFRSLCTSSATITWLRVLSNGSYCYKFYGNEFNLQTQAFLLSWHWWNELKVYKNTEVYLPVFLLHKNSLFSAARCCIAMRVGEQAPTSVVRCKVVPLQKSGNLQSPLNYSPILLTSIACKMLEHVIHSKLASFRVQFIF